MLLGIVICFLLLPDHRLEIQVQVLDDCQFRHDWKSIHLLVDGRQERDGWDVFDVMYAVIDQDHSRILICGHIFRPGGIVEVSQILCGKAVSRIWIRVHCLVVLFLSDFLFVFGYQWLLVVGSLVQIVHVDLCIRRLVLHIVTRSVPVWKM